jgi:hypothetical protein
MAIGVLPERARRALQDQRADARYKETSARTRATRLRRRRVREYRA